MLQVLIGYLVVTLSNLLRKIWMFPLPLMAKFNTERVVGVFKHKENGREIVVVQYKSWVSGKRFWFAAWPHIYTPREDIDLEHKILYHEYRHLEQQEKYGGIGFLALYGLSFLKNYFKFKFDWYKAYYNIDFEKDAREYEDKF